MLRDILVALLEDESKVLKIPEEDASSHEYASMLGSVHEAGEKMYDDLQNMYIQVPATSPTCPNPDYEYVMFESDTCGI